MDVSLRPASCRILGPHKEAQEPLLITDKVDFVF